ncbi:MAG TPA: hypothetical protein VJ960_09990 [Oceanipulchritudo sp.]|nr:hypothetical protein [Oceanipulchritudo sp.]
MPVHLIFLFLFQSGLAFAFSYFIARIVLGGSEKDPPERIKRGIRTVRRIAAGACLILPPLMFIAYFQSLPEGKPTALAIWPAAWILMILAAVVLALSIALRQAAQGTSK